MSKKYVVLKKYLKQEAKEFNPTLQKTLMHAVAEWSDGKIREVYSWMGTDDDFPALAEQWSEMSPYAVSML